MTGLKRLEIFLQSILSFGGVLTLTALLITPGTAGGSAESRILIDCFGGVFLHKIRILPVVWKSCGERVLPVVWKWPRDKYRLLLPVKFGKDHNI